MSAFKFATPLIEGIIKSRPNRFLMNVSIGGKEPVVCHCPSTGAIGNLTWKGYEVPCLLSSEGGKNRKTPYTVEAISDVGKIDKESERKWIGINQNRVNRFIEHFISTGQLSKMIQNGEKVKREQTLKESKIDFKIVDQETTTFIEVKTPLGMLELDDENYLDNNTTKKPKKKKEKYSASQIGDRLIRHFETLADALKNTNNKAIVIIAQMHNAPPFSPPPLSELVGQSNAFMERIHKVRAAVRYAASQGVEQWQVNLSIDKDSVSLLDYFKLDLMKDDLPVDDKATSNSESDKENNTTTTTTTTTTTPKEKQKTKKEKEKEEEKENDEQNEELEEEEGRKKKKNQTPKKRKAEKQGEATTKKSKK